MEYHSLQHCNGCGSYFRRIVFTTPLKVVFPSIRRDDQPPRSGGTPCATQIGLSLARATSEAAPLDVAFRCKLAQSVACLSRAILQHAYVGQFDTFADSAPNR